MNNRLGWKVVVGAKSAPTPPRTVPTTKNATRPTIVDTFSGLYVEKSSKRDERPINERTSWERDLKKQKKNKTS